MKVLEIVSILRAFYKIVLGLDLASFIVDSNQNGRNMRQLYFSTISIVMNSQNQ